MAQQLPSAMGGTFAERAAAAAGKKSYKDPSSAPVEPVENSTFATRRKAATSSKAVASSDEGTEDKAVKRSAAKKA